MPSEHPSQPADPARAAELGRRLTLVTRTAGIGYWSLEPGHQRAAWSDELRLMHGLAPGDEVPRFGDWLRLHVHADDRAMVFQRLQEPLTETMRLTFRIVARDGTVREVLATTMLEGDPRDALLFGVVIDLTGVRRTERALRQAESRAALATRAVGMGTWEMDLGTGEAHWDGQMWLLRGRDPQRLAPTQAERLAMVHPEDRPTILRVGETAAAQAYEFRVVWPDGQVHWLASRSTILYDEDSRPARRIGVNWDITTSRAAEAALRDRELALRASDARQRLLARMSHELRTPLNAVLGFAQLLQADETGDDAAARRRRMCIGQIQQAGDHLLSLVDKVLEVTTSKTAPAAPLAEAGTDGGETPGRRTVLYIEDNAVNTMIVAELVARRGDLQFESAATGAAGLARAAELQPALILLDMQLPDFDGLEVFRRLRADERTAGIPCIALSANALTEDIDTARRAGMSDYWTKPLDFGVFTRSLDAMFGTAPRR